MASISYDSQSLSINGRRIWLVSGAIHYSRTPRELWRSRLRAAKQAGLNCIETYVFWNLHEPSPGEFDFEGDNDLRAFVEMVGEEGMYCWLRPGPYVCSEWDFGGLPPWLLKIDGIQLRESNEPFLEACSRYLGAVMDQVADLQVSAPDRDGPQPIVMIQAENEWFCHNPDQAEKYLRELVRYLLEHGCKVPINVCNNLWQRVDGTIDTWNASRHLPADLRQLAVVQPNAPRIVSEFWTGWFDQWNDEHRCEKDADLILLRSAGILAQGGQYNYYMFHGGTNFGFYGGRTVNGPDCFMTTSYDYDAPLLEAGGRGDKYLACKRISMFANYFGHVFAHLEPDHHHVAVMPSEKEHPVSVIHQRGSQGQVVFMLRAQDDKSRSAELLLPNGLSLTVPFDEDSAAWLLLDANLNGNGVLNYTNLRPWAFLGDSVLVLFGPAGAKGLVSIDDTDTIIEVPTTVSPTVETIQNIHVVVLNREQVDLAYVDGDRLIVGAQSLDENGEPIPAAGVSSIYTVDASGELTRSAAKSGAKRRRAPKLDDWTSADVAAYVTGEAEAFEQIDGPKSFEELDNPYGYGWYRIDVKKGESGKMLAPRSGDRLHIFADGKPEVILGKGEGAVDEPTQLKLKGNVVVLGDNMGRFNYGWRVGERKGLFGHIYATKSFRLNKPKVDQIAFPNPFEHRGYCQGFHAGPPTVGTCLTWEFKPEKRQAMVLDVSAFPGRCSLYINDELLGFYEPGPSANIGRWLLEVGEEITGGKNTLKLYTPQPLDDPTEAAKGVDLLQSTSNVTNKATWSFAPWVMPEDEAFTPGVRTPAGQPCWYRTTFVVSHTDIPLWLEAKGLSKGQVYLNGHNIGRYWVATATGKSVPPQTRYYLPEPWLNTDEPNVLTIFDEHGKTPSKCRLAYDAMGPYNG